MLLSEQYKYETKITSIFNNIDEAVFLLNYSNTIESCNNAVENMFNYSKEEIIGKKISSIIDFKTREENNEFHLLQDQEIETNAINKNGESFPVLIKVKEDFFHSEPFVFIYVKNIRQQKETNTLKNEFISTVSHELKTPLTAIKGSLRLLMNDESLSDQNFKLLNIANNNANTLMDLISDLLDMEQLESGNYIYDMNSFNLKQTIEKILKDIEPYAKEYKTTIYAKIPDEMEPIYLDKKRFKQIIFNLLSNAIKFSHEKSDIIELNIEDKEKSFLIMVKDNGIGIPQNYYDRIFEKFTQVNSTDSRNQTGTGLGLSICKSFVENMQGKIWFKSKLNQGTTFYVEFLKPLTCNLSTRR
ncbi:MAG: PAS domain-containing sensor histidine kinase [Candidatus Gastranaerophilales bacterium]|nr:PAS domain-containing sensor histidine kinase [Candidatus Gastranaerophilales bacterium]